MSLTGGCSVTISINSVMSGFSHDITVCGSAGYISFSDNSLKGKKNGSSNDQVFLVDNSSSDADLQSSGLPTMQSVGMIRLIKELHDVFEGRLENSDNDLGPPTASFSDALYIHAVMEALRRSNDTRQWRKVEMYDQDGGGPIQI